MMQQPERAHDTVLVHRNDLAQLADVISSLGLQSWAGPIAIFTCSGGWAIPDTIPEEFTVRRLFDTYYLLLPSWDRERAQQVFDALFTNVAPEYEEVIDTERNLDNIRTLLTHVVRRGGPGTAPLQFFDIGCGTGLAADMAVELAVNLVGIERSLSMRGVAESRGLRVIDPQELAGWEPASVDGAIASYVFHLFVDPGLLRDVWACLRPESGLSANFHKGWGLDEVTQVLTELNAEVRIGEPHSDRTEHGVYVTFWKR